MCVVLSSKSGVLKRGEEMCVNGFNKQYDTADRNNFGFIRAVSIVAA
jgi:hypothetical protein